MRNLLIPRKQLARQAPSSERNRRAREITARGCNGTSDSAAPSSRRRRNYGEIYIHPPSAAIEAHVPVYQSENCVIATEPNVSSGQKFCAALTHNDIAGYNRFAAEFFDTQAFADAVASVFNTALSFFMSHDGSLIFEG